MKIKTNVRAGAGTNSGGVSASGVGGYNSSKPSNVVVPYVPPVILARCLGVV